MAHYGLIRAHQSSSELIRAHQGSSGLIRAHQGSSGLIRGVLNRTHLDVGRIAREVRQGASGHLRRSEAWVHLWGRTMEASW